MKLVAITHVPTQGGLVNPAEEVGAATREAGVPLPARRLPVGRTAPVDVERIGCDCSPPPGASSCAAREAPVPLRPQRILEQIEPPFLDLHAATWTAPDSYGSARTRDASRTGRPTTPPRSASASPSTTRCRGAWRPSRHASPPSRTAAARRWRACPGARARPGTRRCGIVTFTIDGVAGRGGPAALAERGVNVSVSLVDYARLDLENRGLPDLVRASVHYYNTDDELDRLIRSLPAPG